MCREINKHRMKPWCIGFRNKNHRKTYFHCGPPCMWAYMCVCGCWLWSVRQGWKDYWSGNNFTVCMGNCCDLFWWTVQILSCEGDRTGKNERAMTTNGEVIRKGIQMLEQRKNSQHKKNVFIELLLITSSSSQTPAFSFSRNSPIFRPPLGVPLYCSPLDSMNPSMPNKQNFNLISSLEMRNKPQCLFSFETDNRLSVGWTFPKLPLCLLQSRLSFLYWAMV